MFVDASAICAVVMKEADGDRLLARMQDSPKSLTSPIAVWESTLAISRDNDMTAQAARTIVMRLLNATEIELVAVPPEAAALAVEAFERFGKGRHPAALNFCDCFAYASARHFRVPLLYKGDDFSRTDIETVAIGD